MVTPLRPTDRTPAVSAPDSDPEPPAPTYGRSTYDRPEYDRPEYDRSTYGQPTYDQPTYDRSAYDEPYDRPPAPDPDYARRWSDETQIAPRQGRRASRYSRASERYSGGRPPGRTYLPPPADEPLPRFDPPSRGGYDEQSVTYAYDEPEGGYDGPIRTHKEPVRAYEDPASRYNDRQLGRSFGDDAPPRPERDAALHETGEWTRSGWVPTRQRGDRPNFSVRRFDDTDERPRVPVQRALTASGQVVEDVDWYEQSDPGAQRVTMAATHAEPTDPVTTREPVSSTRPAPVSHAAATRAEPQSAKPSVVVIPPDDLDQDAVEEYEDYDEEDDEEDAPPALPVAVVTLSWYALPATLYLLWLIVVPNNPSLVSGLTWVLPWLIGAMLGGVVLAQILRIASGWKIGGIGFAAAIVSSGATTLIFTIVNPGPT